MAPVLRLYEDTLSNTAETVGLPPVPRMIFVVHGAATIGGSAVSDGETWHGEAEVMIAPGVSGVTGWRLAYERDPEKGLALYFTPLKGAVDTHTLPIGVRWNPDHKRYQSLDRSYEHFLNESPSLNTARSTLR